MKTHLQQLKTHLLVLFSICDPHVRYLLCICAYISGKHVRAHCRWSTLVLLVAWLYLMHNKMPNILMHLALDTSRQLNSAIVTLITRAWAFFNLATLITWATGYFQLLWVLMPQNLALCFTHIAIWKGRTYNINQHGVASQCCLYHPIKFSISFSAPIDNVFLARISNIDDSHIKLYEMKNIHRKKRERWWKKKWSAWHCCNV